MFPLMVCCQILISVNLIRGTESKINAGKYLLDQIVVACVNLACVERMTLIIILVYESAV